MKELSFVQANAEDADLIFSQCKELVMRYEDPNAVNLDRVLSWLENKIRSHISEYTCVLHGNEKVAFFCFTQEENGAELDDFYVLEPYQNQGIGSRILCHLVKSTALPVSLYVFHGNTGAIRLYERFGFAFTQQVSPTRSIMTRYP